MLYIGIFDKEDRGRSTVYFSSHSPEGDWETFERNMQEFRHKDHFVSTDGNVRLPSDIAIGVLTNVLQDAGIKYERIDL